MKEKNKIMIIREIEKLVKNIADKKQWDCYEILKLDIILDDDVLVLADLVVFYRDKNDFDGVLKSKFNKITQKSLLDNAIID